jgi:hypothetical protein
MASVRMQIFAAIEAKLRLVQANLGWATVLRSPREPVGEDQMNALVLSPGGDDEPDDLTGHVETNSAGFSVGMVVLETAASSAEDLLDAGFVAVSNALVDPADVQLGGLAIDVRRGAMSPPYIGQSASGARIVGVQEIEFTVRYMSREGDAETPGP